MVTFEQMTTQKRAACVELAARAFADYEYFFAYVPDDKRRLRFLKAMLTVDPAYEGKGFGSEIMQDHILPYVRDHCGDSLCLFTNSEINRRFYRKNGFEEFHEQQFTYKGKTIGSWSYQIKIE